MILKYQKTIFEPGFHVLEQKIVRLIETESQKAKHCSLGTEQQSLRTEHLTLRTEDKGSGASSKGLQHIARIFSSST